MMNPNYPNGSAAGASMLDQVRWFDDDNPEPRCPCLLAIDVSGSMKHKGRIKAVNDGLRGLASYLKQDALASLRIEIAVLTFSDDVSVMQNFVNVADFALPELKAKGGTNAFPAIDQAIALLQERQETYREHGIKNFQPILLFITDGKIIPPNRRGHPLVTETLRRLETAQRRRDFAFFGIGVGEADLQDIAAISPTPPKALNEARWEEFFLWISQSLASIVHSPVDEDEDIVMLSESGWSQEDSIRFPGR